MPVILSKNSAIQKAPNNQSHDPTIKLLAAILLLVIGLKSYLIVLYPIYEDEFHYHSQVYEYKSNALSAPFQTLHVHFFAWTKIFGNNEVTQIVAARFVMLLLLLGTCWFLFLIARHFLSIRAGLFSILCYLSALFTITNGASFRSDTPALFLIMFSLYIFIHKDESCFLNIISGLSLAVAVLFTIKTMVYFPLIIAIALLRLAYHVNKRARYLQVLAYFLTSFGVGLLATFLIHSSSLNPQTDLQTASYLGRSFERFISIDRLLLSWEWLKRMILIDSVLFAVLILGVARCLIGVFKNRLRETRASHTFMLLLLIPFFSLLFFRYCRPYLLVFLMPTAVIFCGFAYEYFLSKHRSNSPMAIFFTLILGCIVASNYFIHYPRFLQYQNNQKKQQIKLLDSIHGMFPQPVPYIDRYGVVSSFPKIGFFMSEAGMSNYVKNGIPVLESQINFHKPIFMIQNSIFLDLHQPNPPKATNGMTLFERDWMALKNHFIHHAGPIWIAGKTLNLESPQNPQIFEIDIPGNYTVDVKGEIIINSRCYRKNDVLWLDQGFHRINAPSANRKVTLRWGENLSRPHLAPDDGYLAAPFY